MKGITSKVLLAALIVSNVPVSASEVPFSAELAVQEVPAITPAMPETPQVPTIIPMEEIQKALAEGTASEAGKQVIQAGWFSRLGAAIKSGFNTVVSAAQTGATKIGSYLPERLKAVLTNKWFLGTVAVTATAVVAYKYLKAPAVSTAAEVTASEETLVAASAEAILAQTNTLVEKNADLLKTLAQDNEEVVKALHNVEKANERKAENKLNKDARATEKLSKTYKFLKKQVKKAQKASR